MIIENAARAVETGVPLCQDTGTVRILIELGAQVPADLRGLQAALDTVVQRSSAVQGFRASTVRDAFADRSNPGTNTPAFIEITQSLNLETTVHTMLKGGGTDNASTVTMLTPNSTAGDIEQLVLDTVLEKASQACPPLIIGIGIGGTFDTVASLSKKALLRPLNTPATTKQAAVLEERLLKAINVTQIGPAALGGDTTALAVQIETAPSHIASLPLAINLCCHSLRSSTQKIIASN